MFMRRLVIAADRVVVRPGMAAARGRVLGAFAFGIGGSVIPGNIALWSTSPAVRAAVGVASLLAAAAGLYRGYVAYLGELGKRIDIVDDPAAVDRGGAGGVGEEKVVIAASDVSGVRARWWRDALTDAPERWQVLLTYRDAGSEWEVVATEHPSREGAVRVVGRLKGRWPHLEWATAESLRRAESTDHP